MRGENPFFYYRGEIKKWLLRGKIVCKVTLSNIPLIFFLFGQNISLFFIYTHMIYIYYIQNF
jgi:hypothetical protein